VVLLALGVFQLCHAGGVASSGSVTEVSRRSCPPKQPHYLGSLQLTSLVDVGEHHKSIAKLL
jgi:hypothetical protein